MSIGIGDALRDARLEQGRTIEDAAQSLRVRTDYIRAMEQEEFGIFGADAYARGHLRNYAAFLKVDPAPLLAEYDRVVAVEDVTARQVAGAPVSITPREPLPRSVSTAMIAVAILAGVGLIGLLGNRAPETSVPNDPASVDAAQSETPSESARPTPSATPTPTPTFEGVNLVLAFESDCWTRIVVDGTTHPRSEQVFNSGEVLELRGDEVVEIRFGNAAAVVVTHNGDVLGAPGGSGQVVSVTYGPDGVVEA